MDKQIRVVAAKIIFIIFSVELMIMLSELHLFDFDERWFFLIDAILLVLLSTPLIIFLVVKPYAVKHQQALRKASFEGLHDPLTQLPNRKLLYEHLDKCISGSARHEHAGALIFIDLNDFKKINDSNDHETGDKVLVNIAQRLKNIIRAEDVVARYGGDEFIILLHNAGNNRHDAKKHVSNIVNKVRDEIRQPIRINANTFTVDCSFGVSLLSDNILSATLAIREADIAMYEAKKSDDAHLIFSDELLISWHSYARTGIEAIDHEHGQIDYLIKTAMESPDDRAVKLVSIIELIIRHLHCEEQISHKHLLNMNPQHVREHRRLEDLLSDLKSKINDQDAYELLSDVQKVVRHHVLTFDSTLNQTTD